MMHDIYSKDYGLGDRDLDGEILFLTEDWQNEANEQGVIENRHVVIDRNVSIHVRLKFRHCLILFACTDSEALSMQSDRSKLEFENCTIEIQHNAQNCLIAAEGICRFVGCMILSKEKITPANCDKRCVFIRAVNAKVIFAQTRIDGYYGNFLYAGKKDKASSFYLMDCVVHDCFGSFLKTEKTRGRAQRTINLEKTTFFGVYVLDDESLFNVNQSLFSCIGCEFYNIHESIFDITPVSNGILPLFSDCSFENCKQSMSWPLFGRIVNCDFTEMDDLMIADKTEVQMETTVISCRFWDCNGMIDVSEDVSDCCFNKSCITVNTGSSRHSPDRRYLMINRMLTRSRR